MSDDTPDAVTDTVSSYICRWNSAVPPLTFPSNLMDIMTTLSRQTIRQLMHLLLLLLFCSGRLFAFEFAFVLPHCNFDSTEPEKGRPVVRILEPLLEMLLPPCRREAAAFNVALLSGAVAIAIETFCWLVLGRLFYMFLFENRV